MTTLRRSAALALGLCTLVAAVLAAGVAASPVVRACDTWDPAWSPDGSRIAFGATSTGTGGLIETIDPAGRELHVLTSPPAAAPDNLSSFDDDFEPTWAPDGKRLAFVTHWNVSSSTYGDDSLNLLDTATGTVTQVSDPALNAANPTWSRTGLLGYQLFDGVFDYEGFVAGSRILHNPSDAVEWAGPSWAPDGRRFAFEADNTDTDNNQIYVMNRAGRRRRLVTGSSPTWSPDGRWIAYLAPSGERFDLISPDGSRHRRLLRVDSATAVDYSVVWSPSGARLAIGPTVVTLATGKTRNLPVDGGGYTGDPSWSPSGRWLVYATSVLQLVRPDGTGLHAIDPCGLTPALTSPRESRTGSA